MAVDPGLLKRAQDEAARLVEAERQVQMVRADYHMAVRRLHLAGASLRQVAQALEMSHQRVQQIVGSAGGSWWQRAWRSRRASRDLGCSACGRPDSEVESLIAGPEVFICGDCVAVAERNAAVVASADERQGDPRSRRCSFCRAPERARRLISAADLVLLCEPCLVTCRAILDGREATA